jgi:hypothetical protein
MQVLGQVRAFAWSSFGLPKARNLTGGEDEGQEVEKEQEEEAKKEQRTAGGERARRKGEQARGK